MSYNQYSPCLTWKDMDDRPRALTYIRKGQDHLIEQILPFPSRDVVTIVVNNITAVNVYREHCYILNSQTHNAGNMLNLAFTNAVETSHVAPHMASGSDHSTVVSLIQTAETRPTGQT